MPTQITIRVAGKDLPAELNDSETAEALLGRLPLRVRMSRWGDEYYGSIGDLGVGQSADARDLMKVGELAYWTPGTALCIFFGPTPVSVGDEPRAASPVNPLGEVTSDTAPLKDMPSSITVEIEEA